MKLRQYLMFTAAVATNLTLAGGILHDHNAPSLIPAAYADETTKPSSDDTDHAETYRLLTLFGTVMDLVKTDYVEPVSDKDLITNSLNGMLNGLDPHSSYMTQKQYDDMMVQMKGEFGGLGLELQQQDGHIRVVSPIDGTPGFKAGVKPGDYIIAVDGHNIDGTPIDEAVKKMRGKPNTKITLTIVRAKAPKPLVIPITREIIHFDIVKSNLFDNGIGYLRIAQFNEVTQKELLKNYTNIRQKAGGHLKSLIIDLRNDPGGLLDQAISVSSDFIHNGEIVSTKARHTKDNHNSQRWDAHGSDMTNGIPIVVLLNGGSASAAEIVSGALQDHHRAVLIGTRSFGKGSVQSIIPIPGNGAIRLTTARFYTPSGHSIQAQGINPDILVKETRDDSEFNIHEADLAHILANQGGNQSKPQPRNDLPPIAHSIPDEPPENWPEFDYTKPNTDFQLQEAIRVARSLSGQAAPDPTKSLPPLKKKNSNCSLPQKKGN